VLSELRRKERTNQNPLWQETLEAGHVWQRRFYDFAVRSEEKKIEKLKCIHHNPVKRCLVLEPDQWAGSSFQWYAHGERGAVLVNEQRPEEMKMGKRQTFTAQTSEVPTKITLPSPTERSSSPMRIFALPRTRNRFRPGGAAAADRGLRRAGYRLRRSWRGRTPATPAPLSCIGLTALLGSVCD